MHTPPSQLRARALVAIAAAWFVPAACMGGPAPTLAVSPTAPTLAMTVAPATDPPAGAIVIKLTIDTTPVFQPDSIMAREGIITLFLHNPGVYAELHDFQIGTELGKTQAETGPILPHESVVATLTNLAPGTYTFWCELTNHDALGMIGTLVVEP